MKRNTVVELKGPEGTKDALSDMLRTGAQRLIKEALELEITGFLADYVEQTLKDGRQQVVRNGYLPEREIQSGIGKLTVQVPRTRDRGGEEVKFNSVLVPPYLRRTKNVEEVLPWLYLKGISTNDFSEALKSIFGENAAGLSPSSISRLKSQWESECDSWRKRDLSKKRYIYMWADGIYAGLRGEDEKLCLLVLLGVNQDGQKEIIALEDGYRESGDSWKVVLRDLKDRGLKQGPELGIGDGALGFWKALSEVFPKTKEQRCWQHKSMNILDKFPKSLRGQALEGIHDIWMAPSKSEALKAWNRFVSKFKDKYPKAVETLEKDKSKMLTFYDFPAEHWRSIRTTNPIESIFATVRSRTVRMKGCVSRKTMLALAYKLILSASKNWRRLPGFERLAEIIRGVPFVDGRSKLEQQSNQLSQDLEEGKLAA